MEMPTTAQIAEEISTLQSMRPNVRHYSVFEDDHHAAIDAQIHTLINEYDEDDVFEEFAGDASNVVDSAIEAVRWLNGESESGKPSDGWKELLTGGE